MIVDPEIAALVERLLIEHPPGTSDPTEFFRARFDAGLAWVHYPVGSGGRGADAEQHRAVEEALDDAGAPSSFALNPIGIGMVGPTIAQHGTATQRDRYLRPLFTAEEIWCQLFSEPGAGSDLASLATRAECDGDEWVVNGQKVWTSLGHKAHFGLLLARTDVDAPKNHGLTTFLVDMHAPGVDTRPLRQMTGHAEFNEVYLDGVRLGADAQLGPEGKGLASRHDHPHERARVDRPVHGHDGISRRHRGAALPGTERPRPGAARSRRGHVDRVRDRALDHGTRRTTRSDR